MKKAILAVSFGTSYEETRKKTLDVLEAELKAAWPDRIFYRAWTSRMILRKLKERDGIIIPNVQEAMDQIVADGVEELLVQPTHFLKGIENDRMKEAILAYSDRIERISIGEPLLSNEEDCQETLKTVMESIPAGEQDAVVLMGHGTPHQFNEIYGKLDGMLKEMGYPKAFIGTVEGTPELEDVMPQVLAVKPATVYLTPFMMVAGDHATNDMAGEEEDSWKAQFEKEGCQVSCILRGLGEYAGIRSIVVRHSRDAEKML